MNWIVVLRVISAIMCASGIGWMTWLFTAKPTKDKEE